jgi:hypothetical protein
MGRQPYLIDGVEVPSVTTVLKSINKPALVNWASYGSRDATRRIAREAYETMHPEGRCLGLSGASFIAAVEKIQGKRPAHYQVSDEAVDIGTLVHARIEAELRRELGQDVALPEIPEDEVVNGKKRPHPARVSYEAYLKWRIEKAVRPVGLEMRLYSRRLQYAGTTDFLGYVADVLSIADWKTSKAVYDEYRIQVAAYREAYNEMVGASYAVPGAEAASGALVLRFPKTAGDTFEAHDVPWDEQSDLMQDFLAAKRLHDRGLGQ